jgi:hypothetical protein
MSRRIALCAGAALVLAAAVLDATPAYAAGEFTFTVTPSAAHPTETVTVAGDATDPVCAGDGVTVTLYFTKSDGTTDTTSVNSTTDSAGHFTADVLVPEIAYAGQPATVTSVINDCTPPDASPPFARAGNAVDFDVLAYAGTFAISKTSGKPGQTVHFSGTNCVGGEVFVFFGEDQADATLLSDKTFSGDYVLPDAPGGTYEFGAECPGTDFTSFSFTLINPKKPTKPTTPAAKPPTAVGGIAHFTG